MGLKVGDFVEVVRGGYYTNQGKISRTTRMMAVVEITTGPHLHLGTIKIYKTSIRRLKRHGGGGGSSPSSASTPASVPSLILADESTARVQNLPPATSGSSDLRDLVSHLLSEVSRLQQGHEALKSEVSDLKRQLARMTV